MASNLEMIQAKMESHTEIKNKKLQLKPFDLNGKQISIKFNAIPS